MIAISIENVDKIISKYRGKIDLYKTEITDKLSVQSFLDGLLNNQQRDYVIHLEDFIENFNGLEAKKDILLQKKDEFDAIYRKEDVDENEWKKFKDKILYRLGYSDRRGDFYPEYFQKIGIKSCVFCNSQLCVTVSSKDKQLIAKFQVDHYLNKSEYPCFSVSLFNLYPVCASCNLKKGVHNINFDLYVNLKDIKKSDYSFQLKNKEETIAKYLLDRRVENIQIEFNEPIVPANHKSFDEVFSINGIYQTQKDLVEELIIKAEIYTQSYKDSLIGSFSEILNDESITNRIIIGNYIEENQIHNRPMSKFTQDIAKQLGLI